MKNGRNHGMILGDKVLTNMTAGDVRKLSKIMSSAASDSASKTIAVESYIMSYEPRIREWTSKKGTEMLTVQILHDIVDHEADELTLPKHGMHRNWLTLK